MRFFVGLGFGTVFALLVHARSEAEDRPEYTRKGQKYMPYVQGFILPFYMVLIAAFGITRQTVLSVCFSIFLQISMYYAVLIPLLPFLRRRISARACAMLWLIPNYLYLVQSHAGALEHLGHGVGSAFLPAAVGHDGDQLAHAHGYKNTVDEAIQCKHQQR